MAAAIVVLAVLSLAGCGGNTTAESAGAAPVATDGAATSPAESDGSRSGPDLDLLGQGPLEGPVVIWFWAGY